MHDDGLFADLGPSRSAPAASNSAENAGSLADWQITQLRESLAKSGAQSMAERQRLVEEIVGRPVPALRELTIPEARKLLESLAARRQSAAGAGSSWDDRDGDTWIDRL